MESSYKQVPFRNLEAAIKKLKKYYKENGLHPETQEVSFEYMVGSFFPEIIKNIDERINRERTEAFIEGVNSAKERYGIKD